MLRLRYLVLVLISLPGSLAAAQSTPSPRELIEQAVARLAAAKDANHRFTDFDLEHNQNRNEKGKLYADTTVLYEDTWIADLPFKRVVEVNGRPLTGRAYNKEQQRYDRAIRDRSALDLAARAKLDHDLFFSAGFHLDRFTGEDYRLTDLREEMFAGQATRVIEATPIASGDPQRPTPTRHAVLWITTADPTLIHFIFDLTGDEPTFLRGSHGEQDYVVLDGTPLVQHALIHFLVLTKGSGITVDTEHTYLKYRRFTTTTRMLPASEAGIDAPPQM